jgi:hypothetical protein
MTSITSMYDEIETELARNWHKFYLQTIDANPRLEPQHLTEQLTTYGLSLNQASQVGKELSRLARAELPPTPEQLEMRKQAEEWHARPDVKRIMDAAEDAVRHIKARSPAAYHGSTALQIATAFFNGLRLHDNNTLRTIIAIGRNLSRCARQQKAGRV